MTLSGLKTSAGVSLRLGMPKFADAPIFRLDFTMPINPDGRRALSIAFSWTPIFRMFDPLDLSVKRF